MSGRTPTPSLPTDFVPAERATAQELQEDIARFHAHDTTTEMLDAVPDIFLVLNNQRQTVFANQALFNYLNTPDEEDIYGQRPGELLGCTHAEKAPGGCGTTRFCSTCGAARAILSGLRGEETVEECSITQASGNALDLRVWAKPLQRHNQNYTMFSIQDISHEKRRHSLEQIFFHDVLNTAGIVLNIVELLRMDADYLPKLENELDSASKRLVDEIRNQQILLAAESGELQLYLEWIEPVELLYHIANLSNHYRSQNDIKVVVHDNLPSLEISTDRVLLSRIISNMVKNALEASQSGDKVTLSYSLTRDTITFQVHNPAYIPYQTQLQIFKRSFSTKGQGRGLGTYSIKLLTEKYLGGRVWFESDSDLGTTFKIALPLKDRSRNDPA